MAVAQTMAWLRKRAARSAGIEGVEGTVVLLALAVGVASQAGCRRALDRLLSSERTLYRCEACLADGTSCASYSDDCEQDVRWAGSEDKARREAQLALCEQVEKALPLKERGVCGAKPAEAFRFTCSSWRGRCASAWR